MLATNGMPYWTRSDLAGLRERGGEVGLGGYGEQLVDAVELVLGGVVGVRADLGDVGRVAGLTMSATFLSTSFQL